MAEIFLALKTNKKFANIEKPQALIGKAINMSKKEINITG